MELDDFKTTWKTIQTAPVKAPDEIQMMLSESRHPILKKIKRQLLIEILGWMLLLVCYYTMFDGQNKSVLANSILIISVLLPLTHNLAGYRLIKNTVNGDSIKTSLQNYLSKIRRYAVISIGARVLFFTGLLFFFTNHLSFDIRKYLSIAIIILIFSAQLLLIWRIWRERLKQLNKSLATLL